MSINSKTHNHYFKSLKGLNEADVYRVLLLWNVTDPCIQHALKKLLVAGGRGAGKSIDKDIQEAIDSLARWQEMRREDAEMFLHDESRNAHLVHGLDHSTAVQTQAMPTLHPGAAPKGFVNPPAEHPKYDPSKPPVPLGGLAEGNFVPLPSSLQAPVATPGMRSHTIDNFPGTERRTG